MRWWSLKPLHKTYLGLSVSSSSGLISSRLSDIEAFWWYIDFMRRRCLALDYVIVLVIIPLPSFSLSAAHGILRKLL